MSEIIRGAHTSKQYFCGTCGTRAFNHSLRVEKHAETMQLECENGHSGRVHYGPRGNVVQSAGVEWYDL